MIVPPVDPQLEQQQVSDRPPLRDDTRFASGRIAVFQYASVAVFLFLISGFWKLQIQNPEYYNERAQQNSVKSIPVMAPRGRILDRDGRVIVDNHSSFSLILSRETLKEEHLRPISDGLNLDYTELQSRLRRFRSRPKYEPVVIKEETGAGGPGVRRIASRLLPRAGVDPRAAPHVSAGRDGGARDRVHG